MTIKDNLLGVWILKSTSSRTTEGKSIPSVWGDHPEGMLVYTPAGHMTVQVLRTDRLKFASEDARTGTIEEVMSCFEGYNAYYGTYSIDEAQGTVTHQVTRDLIPNFDGDHLLRHFKVAGDSLTLTTTPYMFSGEISVSELVWQKIEGFTS